MHLKMSGSTADGVQMHVVGDIDGLNTPKKHRQIPMGASGYRNQVIIEGVGNTKEEALDELITY